MKIALQFVESGRWRFDVVVFRPSSSWIAWEKSVLGKELTLPAIVDALR